MSEGAVETSDIYECSRKYPGPYTIVNVDEVSCIFGRLRLYAKRPLKFKLVDKPGGHCSTMYTQKFYMTGKYLKGSDSLIPLIKFNHTYNCLPYTFYIIYNGVDLIDNRNVSEIAAQHVIRVTEVQETVPAKVQEEKPRTSETYMWKCLMEGALFRKETCPISLEELTIENICILPCIHCFDTSSINAMARKQCPVCRKDFKMEGVMCYQK